MADIRPNSLPDAITPVRTGDALIIDQGTDGVRKISPIAMANDTIPIASQSEAETGTDNTKRMTPLRTKQSIASEVGVTIASVTQGNKADSAVQSVNGKTGTSVTLDKSDVGLGNVDNTSDMDKPVSTATQAAIDAVSASSGFPDKSSAEAATIPSSVHSIELMGFASESDGLGGQWTDDPLKGSGDTFSSSGRTWYRVKDINRGRLSARLTEVISVNVKDFGAKGDGANDDTAAINAALSGGDKIVFFPSGNYVYTSYMRVFKNTTIEMHPTCVLLDRTPYGTHGYGFVNGEFGNATYATGYDGDGNIIIRGGTMDGSYRVGISGPCNPIAIGHSRNVLIENVTFKNNYQSHFIEINSSRDVVIRRCVMDTLIPGASANREHINIDRADSVGFPAFGSYDNTPVDNLIIEECVFLNGQVGVGTHQSPSNSHRNITIRNNRFYNFSNRAVRGLKWDYSNVVENSIDTVAEASVVFENCSGSICRGNRITNSNTGGVGSSIFLNGGSNCIVGPNIISNTGYSNYDKAYDVQAGGTGHKVITAGADKGTMYLIENNGVKSVINGSTIIQMADDTASYIDLPNRTGSALVSLSTNLATNTANPRGLWWVNSDSSPAVPVAISSASNTNIGLTTGVLSGTTGTDGNFTISSASDNRVYFENRSGSERVVSVQILSNSVWD